MVQDRAQVGLDIGTTGVKRDVAGDVQLELVVRRLRHRHAGACGGLLHRGLLVLHVLGPDVAAQRAQSSANGRTTFAVSNDHASQRANARTGRGAFLRFAHVGAAAQGQSQSSGREDGLTGEVGTVCHSDLLRNGN